MSLLDNISRLRSPLTMNRRIFRAAVIVGGFSSVVKVIAVAKELAVAKSFGRGDAVDAFLIAYLIPGFVILLVAGSMNAALIPTYIRVREQEGQDAAARLVSSAMLCSIGLLSALTIVLAATGPALLAQVAHGFSPSKLAISERLFYTMLPIIVLSGVATTCGAALNAGGRFGLPAVTPILTPLITMALVFVCAKTWGIYAVGVGVVTGAACESAMLAFAVHQRGIVLRLRWYGATPAMRQVGAQYLPLLFGALLTTSVTLVDQSMAACWMPSGSVAALAYGNRIVAVIVGLTSMSLATAVTPYFSEMVARKDWTGCIHTLKTYSRLVLAVTLPITILMIAGSPLIVRLLYQRGAFSAIDSVIVSRVQAMYALQIPFVAIGLLYVRLLTAMKRNDLVMISAGLNLALDIVLNLICIRFFGIAGIALATSMFYVGSFIFVVYSASRLLLKESRLVLAESQLLNGSRALAKY